MIFRAERATAWRIESVRTEFSHYSMAPTLSGRIILEYIPDICLRQTNGGKWPGLDERERPSELAELYKVD